MRTILVLVVLLCCSVAMADAPKAVITGPTEGVPGDLIIVDFSESVADKMKVFIEPTRFPDGKPTYQMSKDGMSAYMATRAGSVFRVELLVSNEEGPDRAVLIITIANPNPTPAPGPGPAPGPTPGPAPMPDKPLPPGRFDMAQWVKTLLLSNVTADKRKLCSSISGNFGNVAAQIAAGAVKSMADANKMLKDKNHSTVGDDADFWGQAVFLPLIAKQNSLASTGKLNPAALDDLVILFNEIRDGFAAAGN